MSIPHSTGGSVILPSLRIMKVNYYRDGRELVVILDKTCLEDLSRHFNSKVLVGDWLTIQAQNSRDSKAPIAQDLAMVKGPTSLQLSRELSQYLHLYPGQTFTITPVNHCKRESNPENRSYCPYIAQMYVYRKSVITHMPGRIRNFLSLDTDTPIQLSFDDFRFQTKIKGKSHINIPKVELTPPSKQKQILRQVVVRRLQLPKTSDKQPTGKSCHFSRASIFSDSRKRLFYFPLMANEQQTLRDSFGKIFQGDLAHGTIKNPRTQKQVTFLLPIQAYMRIFFLYPVAPACEFKPGDPVTLKIKSIIPQRQSGHFAKSVPFDVFLSCYSHESRITLPKHVLELYGLKLYDLVRLHLGGRRFILKLSMKRRLIIAGKSSLGLLPRAQHLETITISKVGKVGKQRRLRRLGKKHEALKTLFKVLIKEHLIPEVVIVDEVEPSYSTGSTTSVRPDLRVVLNDHTLAHVEVKAFNTLARIGLKHEEQFQKYAELGLPLILVTTTHSSHVHPDLLPYFSQVFALEQLEDMIQKSGRCDLREQLAKIVKRIQ